MNKETENLRVCLLNITFNSKEDLDFSDIGTCYLSEKGLLKILRVCRESDLKFLPKTKEISIK